MHALTCLPSIFSRVIVPESVTATVSPHEPLIHMDKLVEYVGDDPDTQRQVFDLCLDLIDTNLPELRRAVGEMDVAAMRRIAHHARGSLGMLGVDMLKEVGEDIEYHYDDLGAQRWRERCEALYDLLEHLRHELQERLAA